ncbi:MAG TPA: PIG-L family deacetylase [Candidatus Saccharimonadales bacterium]|nr:PIG-L family deacetylase [Candidatus Saccharimonadales bacterium]
MEILVVTPHTDDLVYGLAGTLMLHAGDDIHIVAVCSIQQTAAREVAAALGATIEFLDAPYHRISEDSLRVKRRLVEILKARRPTYVFGPPANGDWTADHTTVGQVLLDAIDLAGTFQYPSRVLRFPIASTTLHFQPNVWIDLPTSVVAKKVELAAIMTRGLEDEWPQDLVEWEVGQGLRYSLQVGWPSKHAEAFDALFAVPFKRLPPPEDLPGDVNRQAPKVDALTQGIDLSAGAGATPKG